MHYKTTLADREQMVIDYKNGDNANAIADK